MSYENSFLEAEYHDDCGCDDILLLYDVVFTQDVGPFKKGDKFDYGKFQIYLCDNELLIEMWNKDDNNSTLEYDQLDSYKDYTKVPAL